MTNKWTDGNGESVYHNEFGCIRGRIQKLSDLRWYAEQGTEWCGDYVTEEHAKKAVEHAHQDPNQMPYPI